MREFFRVLVWIWQNRQRLLPMLGNLPTMLNDVGEGMETAGKGAVAISKGLSKQGRERPAEITLSVALRSLAEAITACENQVRTASGLITGAAGFIGDIEVPALTPQSHHFDFGFWRGDLVTGVGLGSVAPFGDVESRLNSAARGLSDAAGWLDTASDLVTQLKSVTDDSAGKLLELGTGLEQRGQQLQQAFPD